MAFPGVTFAFVLNGLILIAVLFAIGYWLRSRIEAGNEPEEDVVEAWYEDAASLAREVQQVAQPSRGVADHDQVQRQVLPLSERIKSHTRTAPVEVEEAVVRDFYDLGIDCYKVGMEHTTIGATRSGVFLEDKLDDLQATAKEFEAEISSRR